jgi:hypothetical protein
MWWGVGIIPGAWLLLKSTYQVVQCCMHVFIDVLQFLQDCTVLHACFKMFCNFCKIAQCCMHVFIDVLQFCKIAQCLLHVCL